MNRNHSISLTTALLAAFLSTFAAFAQSAEPRYVGLLLDEPAVAPMRVESDILAEITQRIVADFNKANADSLYALQLLATSDAGIVDRTGARSNMNDFETLLVYQGDVIAQNTALFNEKVVADLTEYLNSDPEHSVVFLGGSVALFEKLGFGANLKTTALTFGEDRAQNGVIPTNPNAKIFDGVDLDRGIAWITNAAFPAFNTFAIEGDNVSTLAGAPAEGHLNPFLVGVSEIDGQPFAKAFAFGWRVNPIYDSAPETYKANFERLLTNMIEQVGKPIDPDDCVKPRYIAPNFDAIQRALEGYEDDVDEAGVPRLEDHFARLANLRERSQALEDAIANGEEEGIDEKISAIQIDYDSLQQDVMFSYPDLDFASFLYVRRNPNQLGLPENYNSNSVLPKTGYNDELRRFDFRSGENKL
ncbi:MAG: hypothetical protein J6X44_02490, partial [Thermoguttaceae bacterium]|nr:hypothetical protein [Thermoguttaceae bacterium]